MFFSLYFVLPSLLKICCLYIVNHCDLYSLFLSSILGIEDLKSGKIVTPLPPRSTFLDDPLRVLRAIRFGKTELFYLLFNPCVRKLYFDLN